MIPAGYKAPLRRRTEIRDFLVKHTSYYRNRSICSPLAWNVKCYDQDFSAEHLIEMFRTSGNYDQETEFWLDYPEWREPAIAKHAEIEDNLLDWSTDDARDSITEGDCYKSLSNGTDLDVEYEFVGRSGGWLIITHFGGIKLTQMSEEEFSEWLDELDYPTLRNLYRLVVQNDYDLRPESIKGELEWHAAFAWIANCCRDIPRPNKTQRELVLT